MNDVFRALSDPTRREILTLLRSGDKSAGEIAEQFLLARSTLSGHFNVLKAAGLVVTERRATTIVYSLNASAFEDALGAVLQWLQVGEPQEPQETSTQVLTSSALKLKGTSRALDSGGRTNMKTTWRREWPQWTIVVAMFGLALWRWPVTGAHIPVHWNASGQVDRYGGRFEGLLFLPLLCLGLYLLLLVLPRLDPGRANYAQFAKSYTLTRTALLLLLFAIYSATLLLTAGYHIETASVIVFATGALFVVLGGVLGKMRPNWFIGIRTPWTLSSKTAWVKTHRVGGWTFLVMGLLQIAAALVFSPSSALLLVTPMLLAASLGLCVYSYLVWREAEDKIPPAGTLPADTPLS